ncbi:hypothetical protein BDN67DRAFT_1002378 [Paxillus ammoniavirescens]|nr:hypothetical protein BDN67DRAFT_1002378 [Paxillus ammoniavirescens]
MHVTKYAFDIIFVIDIRSPSLSNSWWPHVKSIAVLVHKTEKLQEDDKVTPTHAPAVAIFFTYPTRATFAGAALKKILLITSGRRVSVTSRLQTMQRSKSNVSLGAERVQIHADANADSGGPPRKPRRKSSAAATSQFVGVASGDGYTGG